MAKSAYNNAKKARTSHTSFELKCGYHLQVSYKKNINPYSKSKLAYKLLSKFRKLITVCRKNLQHAQNC